MKELAHDHGDAAGFLRKYQACFATRADGSSWPNWETTWRRGAQYFRGLIRPGSKPFVRWCRIGYWTYHWSDLKSRKTD